MEQIYDPSNSGWLADEDYIETELNILKSNTILSMAAQRTGLLRNKDKLIDIFSDEEIDLNDLVEWIKKGLDLELIKIQE